MKTNTFYNPKNQYNESLASIPYVDKANSDLSQKINVLESSINNKIEDFRTINVKFINEDGKSWNNINDYFKSRLESATDNEIEQLKIELGQTVYIVPTNNNSYEEYICRNPKIISNSTLPEMIRLGTADSIIARVDDGSANSYGAVTLVHNLYKLDGWESFYENDLEGNIDTSKPKNGKAVAPIALKDFYDADIALGKRMDDAKSELEGQLSKLGTELRLFDESIDTRVSSIEKTINSDTTSGEISQQGTRLDVIEKAIGLNGCCSNCGSENCSCENNSNKCSIYCRLNDAEDDRQEHMNILQEHNERVTELEELTSSHTENISDLQAEDGLIRTLIEEETGRLENLINGNTVRIETVETDIESISTDLSAESARAIAAEDQIDKKLDEKIKKCEDADDIFRAEIGEKTLPADGTVWSEIKNIQSTIGIQDAPHEDTIWVRINNNKKELHDKIDAEISRSKEVDDDHGSRISDLERDIENIETEIGTKESTDINIWHSIHTEIKDRASADTELRNNIADALAGAKTYADELKTVTLSEAAADAEKKAAAAKDYADNAKDAAIAEATATAANDATIKADAAKTAAITTATENAKQYTDTSIEALKDLCNNYIDGEVEKLKGDTDNEIDSLSSTLSSTIDSKVSKERFDAYSENVETILETKAASDDLAKTDNKLITVEKDLEDISHELHHLTSQTQFAVRTSIPGEGTKIIQFYNLIGPDSNEWDLVRITSVVANNETIYPEIKYSGELTEEKNDNRQVTIKFEHGGSESLPVVLIVSAFKASEYRIIEID